MQYINPEHIRVDPYLSPLFDDKEITANILRLDLLHPVVSGNKWFKLRYYIEKAQEQNKNSLVTFGGAWSNHIHATAAAGKMVGLKTIGIIRGEAPARLSTTLLQATELGMQLHFISREEYRQKPIPESIDLSSSQLIPEGGYGTTGARGAATILSLINPDDYTHIVCAVGSGTMMAGLMNAYWSKGVVLGISAMKNNQALESDVRQLLEVPAISPVIIHDYHFGGFAKYNSRLLDFMNEVYRYTGIPTDIVYTGKLFFALNDLAWKNYFPPGSKILLIHSGGLQGNQSLPNGSLIF
ncbi:MAG TPA: pyridoxal-phosphate dependent enzyme [Chitinophagaceae bacterium]|nr:pyridoxal-phosphate dependent enzyme [Chitinophagaceae bacterium]HPH31812.1 pyridoxal-phosphate dependent enzyme [Chitinophagaceae bacterium]HPN59018.1 pyridoxal-phosphate dependent enzyme [Chitinophagaceae bacterium]